MPSTGEAELSSRTGTAVDEDFLALVCSDEELLRAEFDAIVEAEWGSVPPSSPRRHSAGPVGRPSATRASFADHGMADRPGGAGGDQRSRQRSPPTAG